MPTTGLTCRKGTQAQNNDKNETRMKGSNFLKTMLVAVLCLAGTANGMAQDWKSILSGVAGAVINKATGESNSIVGTWTYTGPDCKFTSDNLLAKAGGEVAAKKVEEKMSGVLEKLGFKEGSSYTFNADSTYTVTIGSRTMQGTYSYNEESKELTMKTRLGIKTNVIVSKGLTGDTMSLLFKADKLMSLAQNITGAIAGKSSNSAVSTATSLLEEYDGLQLGVSLKKK